MQPPFLHLITDIFGTVEWVVQKIFTGFTISPHPYTDMPTPFYNTLFLTFCKSEGFQPDNRYSLGDGTDGTILLYQGERMLSVPPWPHRHSYLHIHRAIGHRREWAALILSSLFIQFQRWGERNFFQTSANIFRTEKRDTDTGFPVSVSIYTLSLYYIT